ncbi:flagellar brake protein [Marinobacterium litorale]|jgi:hypothetical protein|uniref:flagellar brake protein n=1 Tax=Marinobacterium litorale TaxID=404770 RepID=UPI00042A2A09|nr:flagellar brake protein [Marinobacterium litorale]
MNQLQKRLAGDVKKGLAELAPRVGERVRLEARSSRGRFNVQLIGYRQSGSVVVTAPRQSGSAVVLSEGAVLTARMMAGNWVCSFDTRLIKVQAQPYPHWHLAFPEQVDARRLRTHTRVPVNLAVSVDLDDSEMGMMGAPVSAWCSDIHIEGACIEAPKLLAKIGQKIFVTARVSVAGIDHVVLAPAVVRKLHELESGAFNVIAHGVEFVELEEDTRLILAGFVYQQHLVETGLMPEGGDPAL